MKLTKNAQKVLEKRYLVKDGRGRIVETPDQMFRRVSRTIARVDEQPIRAGEEFYRVMAGLGFLPNSPTLMNAGTALGQLSACFVLPVEDSIDGIFGAVKDMALIHQSGGGTGFSFSKLRPEGDIVRSTGGVASGPVSFMRVFDVSTEVIKQGGRRRGANMGILRMDHPDIEKFVVAKRAGKVLSNFNISVTVDDKFMEDVARGAEYELVNPRGGKKAGKINAKKLFDRIVESAWMTGDPGLVFIDEVNRKNPVPSIGEIESTNPCGEQPLLPYESCNLGSVNLSRMVYDGKINWEKLGETVKIAVRFLDNVIDLNKYPLIQIKKVTRANRKVGLGVMGFAEMLIQLGIPYDSERALKTAEKVMKFITDEAHKASEELAVKRGPFPNFAKSSYKKKIRNATVTTIAPTGTISIIAGTSSGIEPLFAVSYVRKFERGELLETNWLFEKIAKEQGFYSKGLMKEISKTGSVQKIPAVPKDVKRLFVTALDIKPEWHVKMQAAFQKYTDNAVSKTVNLPKNATKNDIKKIYMLAHKLKCKGITVYRYGSKDEQVLYIDRVPRMAQEEGVLKADSEYAGECNICSV